MIAFVDGKAAKLRASCDACNESKVRCSQTKPRCARCEKQDVTCIYGLSRRSHRTAPRMGASKTTTSTTHQASPPNNNPNANPSDITATSTSVPSPESRPSMTDTTDEGICMASRMSTASQVDEITLSDTSHLPSMDLMPGLDMFSQQLSSSSIFADTFAAMNPALDTLTGTSTAYEDYGYFMSLHEDGSSHDSLMSTDLNMDLPLADTPPCKCTSRIIEQLLSIPMSSGDETRSFDVRLSQLRHGISVSEDCLSCICTSHEELSIVTVCILIGHIVQGFETILSKTNSAPCLNSSNLSESNCSDTPNAAAPRLSWGVLQIEPDEEDEMKQHMWFLQFRKLQRVLKQLSASVGRLKSAGGSGHSAHAMACQCIHMWLVQKAEIVKDRHCVQDD